MKAELSIVAQTKRCLRYYALLGSLEILIRTVTLHPHIHTYNNAI